MTWELLIPIIAKEGIDVAEFLFKRWSSGAPPTQADFDEARKAGQEAAVDRLKARLTAANIPLDSDKAMEFLALAQ